MVRTVCPARSVSDVGAETTRSRWEDLLQAALDLIDRANREHTIIDGWTLGGGTALMLRIDHRESYDIDLFVDDPQVLPYLRAAASETPFALGEPAYGGDGATHLKLAFDHVGEIDVIVAAPQTDRPSEPVELLGRTVELETVAEVIAKKVRYRGSSLQPRDVFDIAAALETKHAPSVKAALADMPERTRSAQEAANRLKDDATQTLIAQLQTRQRLEHLTGDALEIVRNTLNEIGNGRPK